MEDGLAETEAAVNKCGPPGNFLSAKCVQIVFLSAKNGMVALASVVSSLDGYYRE
jgi:hypothetical protein